MVRGAADKLSSDKTDGIDIVINHGVFLTSLVASGLTGYEYHQQAQRLLCSEDGRGCKRAAAGPHPTIARALIIIIILETAIIPLAMVTGDCAHYNCHDGVSDYLG